MNVNPETPSAVTAPRPPQLIQSLTGGFNAVATHIYLIIFPVVLDLLLWFGPHVRLKLVLEPAMLDLFKLMRQTATPEMTSLLDNMEQWWKLFLNQYNLLSNLSAFPIGIPSLMAGLIPGKTPFGEPLWIDLHRSWQILLIWLVCSVIGLVLGSLFFAGVAYTCNRQMVNQSGLIPAGYDAPMLRNGRIPTFTPRVLAWQVGNAFLLILMLLALLAVMAFPVTILIGILSLINPVIAQIVMVVISVTLIWVLVPLMFAPHGIFLCGQSALNALLTSVRLVRYSLNSTGLFLLSALVLYQGLGTLWRSAPDNSWIALVGILGNAFITTGLLAASYVFYRNGLIYLQALRRNVIR